MAENIKYKLVRDNIHVQLYFTRPLFKWSDAHVRFFEMLYELLGERLNIQSSEFSIFPNSTLGEVRAKFSVFGGTSSVSLFADRMAFDFPNLFPSDLPIVHEIMGSVHDGFGKYFPEIEHRRVEIQDYAHLDIGAPEAVDSFLDRYRVGEIAKTFGETVLENPSWKFTVVAQDGSWQSAVTVERSQMQTSALFAAAQISLHKLLTTQSYLEKAQVVFDITSRCLRVINLENENAPT